MHVKEICLHGTEEIRSKKKNFLPYRVLDLSVTELRSIAKNRRVRGYNSLD